MNVFVVQHSYEVEPCGHDEVKFIGVYSTKRKAQAAVRRLRTRPGFRRKPNCFDISDYLIDKDHWTEGYVTVRP